MKPIQSLILKLRTGDESLLIQFPSEPATDQLQASFLTIALDILAETDRAVAVMVAGDLKHCALLSPHNRLVLDASGIQPMETFAQCWAERLGEAPELRILNMTELQHVCPPESGFFARALASFEKVVVQHLSAATAVPALLGFQVQSGRGRHWADRPSDEILSQELATRDLLSARAAEPGVVWLMIAIFDGDIEEPTFL